VRISTRPTPSVSRGAGSNYTNRQLEPLDHAVGRSRGGLSTKIHQLVDGNGLALVTILTPGQGGDSPMFLPLMKQLRVGRPTGRPRTRPDAVRADKAYSSRAIRAHLRGRKIKAVIPEPDDQKGNRQRRGSRGGRPVGLDAADYKNRNVIERHYCHLKQWRGLATRYDKHAEMFYAAVTLNAVIAWAKQLSDMP
jgi:transposase